MAIADVVTMNSTMDFENVVSGQRFELTLVYPKDLDGHSGKISILAPVASALLGLAVGQQIQGQVPGGSALNLRVLNACNQPEARNGVMPRRLARPEHLPCPGRRD